MALEEKDKKETEEKLGKQIETLKKDQEKLKIKVKFFERERFIFSPGKIPVPMKAPYMKAADIIMVVVTSLVP